ncbi:hypothetical protein BTA51_04150 [Hahella sp. CCB-MM4]|nr:hypothetical protein BTA51_04150 [Hahella sp. CCB-MM4]
MWIEPDFTHVEQAADLGLLMHDAVTVDAVKTYQAYRNQLDNWETVVGETIETLRLAQPDLILTNNSYLLSDAAHALGIPCLHFCSLNWAALFQHYCHQLDHEDEISRHLITCYNKARNFLRVTPGLPMAELNNVKAVGPIGRTGHRLPLSQLTGRSPGTKFVLVSMGGIPYDIPYTDWPAQEGVCWLITTPEPPEHPGFISLEQLGLEFIDVVASCDAIITKPGYGTFVEAALHAKPVLYLSRKDWPEEPYLVSFLESYGLCREISPEQLARGNFLTDVLELVECRISKEAPEMTGVDDILAETTPHLS